MRSKNLSNRQRRTTAALAGFAWLVGVLAGVPTLAEDAPALSPAVPRSGEPDPLFDDDFEFELPGFPDPLEEPNRGVLKFNMVLDRWVFDPVTHSYRFLTPAPVRKGIRQFLLNLSSPAVMVNDLLQLEFKDAGVTLARLLLNTTFGVGGFVEAGEAVGLERHNSDFGQTLAIAGVGSGPYLIVPFLGPTCLRDGTGVVVDAFMNPVLYVLGPLYLVAYGGGLGLSERDLRMDEMTALQESSIDFYAVLRSAYYQDRRAAIWSRRARRSEESAPEVDESPTETSG